MLPAKAIPEFLDLHEGWGSYRPRGEITLTQGVDLVSRAFELCRERVVPKLLVDVRGLHGFAVPTLVDRFWMAQDFAAAAGGAVIAAMVALPEHIHPQKFGIKAAADAGLVCDVFTAEEDALEWLRAMPPPVTVAGRT